MEVIIPIGLCQVIGLSVQFELGIRNSVGHSSCGRAKKRIFFRQKIFYSIQSQGHILLLPITVWC